jgi:hypothetical protein
MKAIIIGSERGIRSMDSSKLIVLSGRGVQEPLDNHRHVLPSPFHELDFTADHHTQLLPIHSDNQH